MQFGAGREERTPASTRRRLLVVAAMVAVGLWGAFLGIPALWLLPVVFPLVMAGGGVLGLAGLTVWKLQDQN